MAFISMVFVFLGIAALILGGIELLGLIILVVSGMKREKAIREGVESPSKIGMIIGIILMAVPVLIVGGLALFFMLN